ncbi:MAG: CHAT domain-containing protein [Salinivirgaceae bacterium]|nr:CHAT domain-containing protein [Salinivirgaceae bacterium]
MKTKLFLIALIIFSLNANSQSFVKVWNKVRQLPQDTIAYHNFYRLCEELKYDEAISFIDSVRQECLKNELWNDYLFYSNDIVNLTLHKQNYNEAYDIIIESTNKYRNNADTLSTEYALSISEALYCLLYSNKSDLKYKHSKRLYEYCKLRNAHDTIEVVIYGNISGIFANNLEFTKAYDCAMKCNDIIKENGWNIWSQTPMAIFMGYMAVFQGKEDIAINFYETSLLANEMKTRKDSLYYLYVAQGLTTLYFDKDLLNKCLNLSLTAAEINEKLNSEKLHDIYSQTKLLFKSNIFQVYLEQGNNVKADSIFNIVLELAYLRNNYQTASQQYLNYAGTKLKKKEYEKAIEYLYKGKQIYDSANVAQINQLNWYYTKLCEAYIGQENYKQAVHIAQEGLFKLNGDSISIEKIDTLPNLKTADLRYSCLELLQNKTIGLLRMYTDSFTLNDYNTIVAHIDTYITTYKEALASNNDKESIVLLQKNYKGMLKEIIQFFATHNTYKNTICNNAYLANIITQSRAQQLNNEINELNYIQYSNQKDSNIIKLSNLKTEIRIKKNKQSFIDKKTIEYKKNSFDLSDKYINLLYLESVTNTPRSIDSSMLKSPINLAAIQTVINDDEAIIEFSNTNDNLFSFMILNDTVVFSYSKSNNLGNEIQKLYREIKTGNNSFSTSDNLYDCLLKPYETQLKTISKLTIIPDEKLATLPFELLNEKTIKGSYSISYCYSSSLLFTKQHGKTNYVTKNNILIAAPIFNLKKNKTILANNIMRDYTISYDSTFRDGLNLGSLPSTKIESKEIEKLYKKNTTSNYKSLLGIEATKQNLLTNISNYNIIHIASHGIVNKSNPLISGIIMYPEESELTNKDIFYNYELYNMELNADLVVLSACKTGTGEIVEGEGVMALPRGFIYAGVPNVIASLWKVHDERTKDLMVAFYKHLLEDKVSYAEALRLAKLDCIAKGFLPVDWAGFVLIGN